MTKRRDALAARREALGWTQEELALHLGVELSTVGRWERGVLKPRPPRRRDLARALRLPLDRINRMLEQQSSQGREDSGDAALITARQAVPAPHSQSSEPSLANTAKVITTIHQLYQSAQYAQATRLISAATTDVAALLAERRTVSREANRLQCSLSIATAKLATKAGHADDAWTAAEQADHAASTADDTSGLAAAAYQRTCALLRAGHSDRAEDTAMTTLDGLSGTDPQSLTWRGSLTLISAITAARRGDAPETARRLDMAGAFAGQLGEDSNLGWMAFGPTNVQIHRLSAAVALGDPRSALAAAEHIDVRRLPEGLQGRRARFFLDSAWAHAQLREDAEAVIHLLDTERVAPELVRVNPSVHGLIGELLTRRRHQLPGLRGLAERVGVEA